MSLTADHLLLKMKATKAAADRNCTAVASAEPSAAKVSFQRIALSHPLTENVNSAVSLVPTARQFSGRNAKFAAFAEFAAFSA